MGMIFGFQLYAGRAYNSEFNLIPRNWYILEAIVEATSSN